MSKVLSIVLAFICAFTAGYLLVPVGFLDTCIATALIIASYELWRC